MHVVIKNSKEAEVTFYDNIKSVNVSQGTQLTDGCPHPPARTHYNEAPRDDDVGYMIIMEREGYQSSFVVWVAKNQGFDVRLYTDKGLYLECHSTQVDFGYAP